MKISFVLAQLEPYVIKHESKYNLLIPWHLLLFWMLH